MAKSNKQRQQEWRERQKSKNLQEYRAKELHRVQSYKNRQNQSSFHQKHREATRRWREGKKLLQGTPANITPTKTSEQILGKAVKCVTEDLSKRPSKKRSSVCANLANSSGVINTEKKVINTGLSVHVKEAIQNFYLRNDISLYLRGDVDVRDENTKKKEQERVLTMTIAEAYRLFLGENPTITVGKSKFAELRPEEVLLSSKMPHNVCGCIYHTNIALLLEELHRKLPENFPLYGEEFVKTCVCNISYKRCMTSNCVLCKTRFQATYVDKVDKKHLEAAATWYQWEKGEDGQTEKIQKKGTFGNLLSTLQNLLKKFLLHYFIYRLQTKAYNACRLTATAADSNTAMVQMDFSENFNVYKDEISSTHRKKNGVTLYSVMIWFRNQSISMVLLSDNNNHDKTTVVPYTAYVLNYIKDHFGENVHNIEIWTDGSFSQFKNKYIFAFVGITLPLLIASKIFWNYLVANHGKGAVDCVGGGIKQVATQAVVTRKVIIKDAVSMFNAVNEKTKSHLAVMTQEYIESTLQDLGMHILWQDINALPDMMHIHRVEQTDDGKISTRMFYSDRSCTTHTLNSVELAVVNKHQVTNVSVGDYVIVKYEGTFFPGEVLHLVPNQSATISTMESTGSKFWKWPTKQDVLDFPLHDIERVIKPPTIVSNHDTLSVPELDDYHYYNFDTRLTETCEQALF